MARSQRNSGSGINHIFHSAEWNQKMAAPLFHTAPSPCRACRLTSALQQNALPQRPCTCGNEIEGDERPQEVTNLVFGNLLTTNAHASLHCCTMVVMETATIVIFTATSVSLPHSKELTLWSQTVAYSCHHHSFSSAGRAQEP